MRDNETLRTALFEQIEGLHNGTVKPETAKATAACAMAICKTVDLDLRAQESLKPGGLKALILTGKSEAIQGYVTETAPEDGEKSRRVLAGHKNGLSAEVIAKRAGLDLIEVELIIASAEAD